MIPKIIHYCWFGGKPKPEIVNRCINSWQKFMPGYEIKEWNESNYDVTKSVFMQEAYEAGKWAFVSDYARFDIINTYGGIYMDTDVELLKPIPIEILENEGFTGFESAGKVGPGLIFAASANFPLNKAILDDYNNRHFIVEGKEKMITVNEVISNLLLSKGLKLNDEYQVIEGLAIFPSSVFCGYDQDVKEIDIHEDTISVHHYAGTWTNKSLKKTARTMIKKLFGVEGYRRFLNFYRRFKG